MWRHIKRGFSFNDADDAPHGDDEDIGTNEGLSGEDYLDGEVAEGVD